ncbi:MAG TPA: hypothetical protein VHL14_14315, partial [Steroidobacteraceae bacterium]|nr:hypothetical protein [Steroidobacteraceae bacterium]
MSATEHWLMEHRSGWYGMITEAGIHEHYILGVNLRGMADGHASLTVTQSPNGDKLYLRYIGPNKWSYSAWGGLVKSWA